MDDAIDQYDNNNFSEGPKIFIADCAETRLPASPLPPELFVVGDRLDLKLLALFMSILCLAIFVLDDIPSLGAVTLFISLATRMAYIIALLEKRAHFIAQPHAPLEDGLNENTPWTISAQKLKNGVGERERTLVCILGSCHSNIEPHPPEKSDLTAADHFWF